MSACGARIPIAKVSINTGDVFRQGNVDPVILFAEPGAIEAAVRDVLQKVCTYIEFTVWNSYLRKRVSPLLA